MRFTRLVALACIVCLLVPSAGEAARRRKKKPPRPQKVSFTYSQSDKDCHAGAASVCGGGATSRLSGHFGLDSYMISPSSGKAPGTGYTRTLASITGVYLLRKAVKTLPVSATLRIDTASVRHTGVLNGKRPAGIRRPDAGLALVFGVYSLPCAASCPTQGFVYQERRLLDLQHGPFSMARKTFTMKTVLRPSPPPTTNGKRARATVLKPGKVYIVMELRSFAELGSKMRPAAETAIFSLPKCLDRTCALKPYECYGPDCAASIKGVLYSCADPFCFTGSPMELLFGCALLGDCTASLSDQTLPDSGVARAVASGSFVSMFVG